MEQRDLSASGIAPEIPLWLERRRCAVCGGIEGLRRDPAAGGVTLCESCWDNARGAAAHVEEETGVGD